MTWQWRQAVANLGAAEAANRKAQARFDLAMEAVRAFTTGASEDVILKEKALEGLRKKLLGQSQSFYEKLRVSLEGETDRASRSALAEALFDAGSLYAEVDAPEKALEAYREALALRAALVREQPGDPAARRDLGRSHLALAQVLLLPGIGSRRRAPSWAAHGACSSRWRGSTPTTAAPACWKRRATASKGRALYRTRPARRGGGSRWSAPGPSTND